MGRESRRELKTVAEHVRAEPNMPPRLKWMLAHPRTACLILFCSFPVELVRGMYVGLREAWKQNAYAIETFASLARGRDAK